LDVGGFRVVEGKGISVSHRCTFGQLFLLLCRFFGFALLCEPVFDLNIKRTMVLLGLLNEPSVERL
jgi:hypothetical protein